MKLLRFSLSHIVSFSNWLSKSAFDRPVQDSYAFNKRTVIDSKMNRPLTNGAGFFVMGNQNSFAVGFGLFDSGGPPAILFGIALIVVNSIYLKPFLVAWSHVVDEVIHIMPMLTQSYSTATISCIALVAAIITTLHHRSPDMVKRILPRAVFCNPFPLQAPATSSWFSRRCLGFAKAISSYKYWFATAITLAFSVSSQLVSMILASEVNNGKPSKLVTNVNFHNDYLLLFCYSVQYDMNSRI